MWHNEGGILYTSNKARVVYKTFRTITLSSQFTLGSSGSSVKFLLKSTHKLLSRDNSLKCGQMKKNKARGVSWEDLDIFHVDSGTLCLKYPSCKLIRQHLTSCFPLQKALRSVVEKLKRDFHKGRVPLPVLIKHCTLDGASLSTLLQHLHRNSISCVKSHGKLTLGDLKALCKLVMKKLGPSHTEQVYELALSQELYLRNIPHVRQMPIAVKYDQTVSIPSGIVDLEVDHRFLLELKQGSFSERHRQQLNRYMSIMRSNGRKILRAMVVCFQVDGAVSFSNA